MTQSRCGNGGAIGGLVSPTRNRYFQGKLLDAWHFELEQTYFNRKRQLLNRVALGSGVMCGLHVAPTNDGKSVVVGPGVALDALGREIVVPVASTSIDVRQPTDACGRPSGERIVQQTTVQLCLIYHECEDEPVPVRAADCGGRQDCAHSLFRERYGIVVRVGGPPEQAIACSFPGMFVPPALGETPPSVHARLAERLSQRCAEVSGDVCVVLASLTLPASIDDPITPAMIDPSVRPLVYGNDLLFELIQCLAEQVQPVTPAAPELTNISSISWSRGEHMSIADFVDPALGLTLNFSQALKAGALSANLQTWLHVSVEYPVLTPSKGRAPQPGTTIHVQRLDGTATANAAGTAVTFRPAPRFLDTFQNTIDSLAVPAGISPLCRVIVKCDALLDANDRAVDGNCLGGVLPTGDGTPGGEFESWLQLDQ